MEVDYRTMTVEQMNRVNKSLLIEFIAKLPSKDAVLLEISNNIQKLNDKFAVQENVLNRVLEENKNLKKKVRDLEERLFVENDINKLDTYTRRNNIEVHGIPSAIEGEALEITVKEVAKKIGIDFELNDVEACHRLHRDNGPKPVIVRFVNRRVVEKIHKEKKKLKDTDLSDINGLSIHSKIFFNENLCPAYQKLFRMVYKLKKNGIVNSVWSFNGEVFYKILENGERIHVISERKLKESFPDSFKDEEAIFDE